MKRNILGKDLEQAGVFSLGSCKMTSGGQNSLLAPKQNFVWRQLS
jgi:hypothetical protein